MAQGPNNKWKRQEPVQSLHLVKELQRGVFSLSHYTPLKGIYTKFCRTVTLWPGSDFKSFRHPTIFFLNYTACFFHHPWLIGNVSYYKSPKIFPNITCRVGNKRVTIRGIFCHFSKFFGPGLFFCTQFCMRTRGNLLLSRGKVLGGALKQCTVYTCLTKISQKKKP